MVDDLNDWPVIILPEPGIEDQGRLEDLREYVAGGGTLIAVGNSLMPCGHDVLEEVFGVQYLEPLSFKNCHFVPADCVRGETDAIPLQIRGQAYKIRLSGARSQVQCACHGRRVSRAR